MFDEGESSVIRRVPSVFRNIADIKPEDIRISIVGTIVGKEGDFIVIDDGTGQINVSFDREVDFSPNQLVRVMGRIIPVEGGFELQGEIIQDMSKLDIELFKKINSITVNMEV